MHLLRKIFGKRKTVKRRHITQFRGSGNSAMIYDSSQREWVYLYLLNIDYGCGHVLPASSWDESELRKIALSNSNATHYSDPDLTRTEPNKSNATDSDYYRATESCDSSSNDSYDSYDSSCGSSSSFD